MRSRKRKKKKGKRNIERYLKNEEMGLLKNSETVYKKKRIKHLRQTPKKGKKKNDMHGHSKGLELLLMQENFIQKILRLI
jgi:hypothetical protein